MRFGRMRWLILPLPLFLFWPLLLVAWLGLGLVWLATSGRSRPDRLLAGLTTLRALSELSGTRIDVRGQDRSIYMRFI
jgi:hypothetical protein